MNRKCLVVLILAALSIGVCVSLASSSGAAVPVGAKVEIVPSRFDGFLAATGNITVVFSDGHTESWTEDGCSTKPLVSPVGDVGWVHVDKSKVDTVKKIAFGRDDVTVRINGGSSKIFRPVEDAPFIENWGFVDLGRSVAIESRGHHGHPYYVKYDLKTGNQLEEITEYTAFEELPKWAQSISDR